MIISHLGLTLWGSGSFRVIHIGLRAIWFRAIQVVIFLDKILQL